ncbi:flagellar inner arm dynein light chain [Thamnocephalis sphaerospora]|uniref:Flagellar inner arm dynein light chain n=1 Tax=Thamnocephalis sphaerospora TaxID=78915 RepID=A0A4P9XUN2_9FUNG|nr:flagellar inner arm dynein light chain [Thamnocephalis sphaerospora]|eukprot:RKP09933.1 flagellar inner arm dynein light chain [Thamnocephalis sphaerospora]
MTTDAAAAAEDPNFVGIRPNFTQKFRPAVATKIIQQVLQEQLRNATYDAETATATATQLADMIKTKMQELELSRYKYVVNVVIGENAGVGARMDCRCFWDADTDKIVQETFSNDSLYCVAVAFGAYLY